MNLPKKFDIKSLLKDLSSYLKRIISYEILSKGRSASGRKLPTFNLPKINLPEFKLNVPKFEINIPKINPPKLDLPKFTLPSFDLPKFKLPQIKLPKINPPSSRIPEVKLPRFKYPTIKILKIELPRISFKFKLPKPKIDLPEFKLNVPKFEIKMPKFSLPKPSLTWFKPSLTWPKLRIQKILSYKYFPLFAVIAIVLFSSAIPQVLSSKISNNNVLGVETFIAPSLGEGGLLNNVFSLFGKTAEKTGSLLKVGGRGGFVVPFVGKSEKGGGFVVPLIGKSEPTAIEDLKVTGKASFAKDIESLGNLKVKGEATVGKLKTGIIDPYLIENDGDVKSTLEIKTLPSDLGSADIVFTPGGVEKLRIKEGGDVVFNGSLSGIKDISSTGNLSVGGDLSVTGTISGKVSIDGNTFSSTKLVFAGSSPSIYPSTSNSQISLNASGTGAINIGNSGTGDVYIAGGSDSTGCTITNSNGSLSCSGNITSKADLVVNGGDITTDQTTFSLINITATTLNVGGAATTISMGAATGTTTVNNALTVTGAGTFSSTLGVTGDTTLTADLTVNGGDLTTTATTFNLLNAATTFNIGSTAVARTINIGTGTLADTIHIGEGGTTANTITIGTDAIANTITIGTTTSGEALSLADDNWNITAGGLANFVSIGAATAGTGAFTTISASGAIAANGGITFDAATDTLGAFTMGGNIIGGTYIITDIGNTGTDFVATTGALTLAGVLTANGGVTVAGGQNLALSSGTGTYTQTNAQTTDATADAMTLTLSAGGTGETGILRGLVISQSDTATTGVFDSLAYIGNLKTPETTTNGLFIEQNAASGTMTNALQIAETAGTITDGILITGTLGNILNSGSIDITGAGAITGATGVSSTTGTFSEAIAANGGITFDAATDTLGAFTMGGNIIGGTYIITDIGNTGTDFVATTGALTLAGVLTANGGVTVAGGQNLALSSGTGTYTQTNAQTTDATADAFALTLSAGGTGETGVLRGLVISQGDTATTGVFDSLAYITNLKTPETTTNGLLIDQNAASGTLSNALHITNTAGTLTTAILIDGTAPGTNILDTGSIDVSGAGAVSGATTITGSGNINSTGGALQTNSITRIDNAGAVSATTGSFAGAVTPSADDTHDLGTSALRWQDAFFSGDVTAGDLVFKNNFRFTENGDEGINILNPKGEVIGGFDYEGNLWMKGEIKQWGKN